MAEKIIFLDFDGVITSEPFTRKCIFEYRRENLYGLDWFDPDCIDALKTIIDATGAKIVVSSSWRDLGMTKLQKVWVENEMPGELIGTTPIWVLTKVDAIKQWLKDHPCERFIVLDDSLLDIPNLIKSNPRSGLSKKDADNGIELLNKKEINNGTE